MTNNPISTTDAQATRDREFIDAQLRALGFKFESDDHSMAIIRGDTIVTVQQLSEHPDYFALTITVPKGVTFTAFTRRKDLLDAHRIRETCGGRQTRSVAAQQLTIRNLSKRYRELRDRPKPPGNSRAPPEVD